MSARPALGRGLNALIPGGRGAAEQVAPTRIGIALIDPNPDQPRQQIDEQALAELAASIEEVGVLQPLLVRRAGDRFQLVAGERRWRAAQLAGLAEVPIVVTDIADSDLLAIALIENIQREDLSPLEEARAYEQLLADGSLTQEQVADRVGKSRTAVANSLRLLKLPGPIGDSLAAGEISEGHARAILGAPDEEAQTRLWQRVKREGWSVRQTEQAVRGLRTTAPRPKPAPLPGDRLAAERLQNALGTRVDVRRGRRGGRLVIRWYDDEQFEQLVRGLVSHSARPSDPVPESIDI